jgi:GNAT superfamily N-acetyltransferase
MEIVRSSAARAGAGRLWHRAGGVGVLAGPAPVVWVYGNVAVEDLLQTLGASPDVHDVYVDVSRGGVVDTLLQSGWSRGELMHQLVCDEEPDAAVEIAATTLLGPEDLPALRSLLATDGASEELLRSSYGDDFFIAAAPVRVVGMRDADGRLVGAAAVRRQNRGALGFGLAVAPEWRSRGLGVGLVRAAVEQAFGMGATFVHAQAHDASAALLERCGFVRVGAWQQMVRG